VGFNIWDKEFLVFALAKYRAKSWIHLFGQVQEQRCFVEKEVIDGIATY
jgi:hypothetical protein